MQVICTDGTTFACESYELTEYGVVCYSEEQPDDGDRYDRSPDQIGYVPHDCLWYVLPDGVAPAARGVQSTGRPAPASNPPDPQGVAPPAGGTRGGETNRETAGNRLARPGLR